MKTICVIIGIVCLYYDFSAMHEPIGMHDTIAGIIQSEEHHVGKGHS